MCTQYVEVHKKNSRIKKRRKEKDRKKERRIEIEEEKME